MNIKTYIVDAFTDQAFKGNPAGICLLKKNIDTELMQSIANELNLSETAFLLKKDKNNYTIRYFTPTVEIDFCGHASLAASKIIIEKLGMETVNFTTSNGLVIQTKSEKEFIKMVFPLYNPSDFIADQKLYEALGLPNKLPTKFSIETGMVIIEVKGKQKLLSLKPDFKKLTESQRNIKAVVITSRSEENEYDFYSRCFCPWIGINEDPVTGSSHSILAGYWNSILNKKELSAFQISSRGGYLKIKILNDKEIEVSSQARIVLEGELII